MAVNVVGNERRTRPTVAVAKSIPGCRHCYPEVYIIISRTDITKAAVAD